ncbi:NB-ARC domain-containing protein [Corchorus capsularis]|uniref:NB-ARC domain-containing protein n=1 Tax=Corchorus capsularis TaxID=210143 RepID=A0A1R3JTC0_COCAP|nr:NB-ARC domain-containing protein [Corchorus capsularis]
MSSELKTIHMLITIRSSSKNIADAALFAPAADAVAKLGTEYALPYVSYFFNYDNIVKDFKMKKVELEMKIDQVKDDVVEATMQTKEIKKYVNEWLEKAEKELGEANSLADSIDKGNKCFNWCPNWGWRGGETTLARVVGRDAREGKLFDQVVIVTMSQKPNINMIQERIAEDLGCFKFETTTEEGRAKELWQRLKSEKKILIIVDDVWKEIEWKTIGIPVVGKSLKIYESPHEWRAALQRLRDPANKDNEEIYSRIELSYDYLRDENIQSCFLLCSLFQEDVDIGIEELTICAAGQGLFGNVLMEDLRGQTRVALRKLQKSGLLFESDEGEGFVRMHDVVRDFAHWITLRGENKFLVKDGLTVTELWLMSESFKFYTAIALWNIKIKSVPEKLDFSKLKILLLEEAGENSLSIPSNFFERMNCLRVLLLGNVTFSSDALQFLPDLRALILWRCKLIKSISSLRHERKLNKLEILQLYHTINELPEELVEFCTSLKSLHFEADEELCNFSPNMVSR